jgi:amino acid transporter
VATDSTNNDAAAEDSAHGLRRELGVFSLVLTQILFIVGAAWIGVAATVGHAHAVLWIAAVVLFFLPLAMLVANLASLMPLEGGIYRWAEAAFGPAIGFMVAWNLWSFTVLVLATIGVNLAGGLSYVLDGFGGYTIDNPWHVRIVSFVGIGLGAIVVAFGLRLGKWVHGVGGALHIFTFSALIIVPIVAIANGRLAQYHPLEIAMPAMTLFTLNVFSKLSMGAFAGFEYIAILAGECKDPKRTLVRSVWISAPIIVAMFILGTCSMVALVPHDRIDLIAPLPQTVSIGFGDTSIGLILGQAIVIAVVVRYLAVICLIFAGSVRLPMVAAWQGQAPGWLGKLSQRFGTPLHSAALVAVIVAALTVASQFGAHAQEAYQLLDNAATVLYALTYVALFAIPIVGQRALRQRIPRYVRVAAIPGLIVTLLAIVLALVPIVDVASGVIFAAKILGTVAIFNGIGVWIYRQGRAASRRDAG